MYKMFFLLTFSLSLGVVASVGDSSKLHKTLKSCESLKQITTNICTQERRYKKENDQSYLLSESLFELLDQKSIEYDLEKVTEKSQIIICNKSTGKTITKICISENDISLEKKDYLSKYVEDLF